MYVHIRTCIYIYIHTDTYVRMCMYNVPIGWSTMQVCTQHIATRYSTNHLHVYMQVSIVTTDVQHDAQLLSSTEA